MIEIKNPIGVVRKKIILVKTVFLGKKKKNTNKTNILKILIIIDVILLFLNIYFFSKTYKSKKIKNKFNAKNILEIFRNVDYYNMKITTYSFEGISNYLTSKFNYSKNIALMNYSYIETDNKKNIIKTVRIYYKNIHPRWIKLINESVKDKINLVIDKKSPEYLIYATFGCSYLSSKYKNAIKIAFFTENQLPDLYITDYAIGMSHISYLDRYFHLPYLIYYLNRDKLNINNFTIAREKALKYRNRTKFCASVITNPCGKRVQFMNEISKYKEIDHGGRFLNNIGKVVRKKIEFLSQYKFSIAMENSEADGYLSEKLLEAFLAGNIPIYYGDYMMDEFINPKSFILIRNRNDLKEKIEYIKKIDNDDKLYESILKEKIFIDNDFMKKYEKTRNEFLLNIFLQKKELAKRKEKLIFPD